MTIANPIDVLKLYVQRHETQRAAAERLGVSQAYLSDLLRGHRRFSDPLLSKLGLARVVITKVPKEKK